MKYRYLIVTLVVTLFLLTFVSSASACGPGGVSGFAYGGCGTGFSSFGGCGAGVGGFGYTRANVFDVGYQSGFYPNRVFVRNTRPVVVRQRVFVERPRRFFSASIAFGR